MIAIHESEYSFSNRWISYCQKKKIDYKIVNCYSNEIIRDLENCDALMWHHNNVNSKDILFAKQLIFSLEQSGMIVFPDFNTTWHFDDKLGQKYLFEAFDLPNVNTYVFYQKHQAVEWARCTTYPKVFKLRSGAGSDNVKMVRNFSQAKKVIDIAFGKGFSQTDVFSGLKERWRLYRLGFTGLISVVKGIARFVYPNKFTRIAGKEKGYVYFQDFIPGNDSDIRVIVIHQKAFAIKRMVRENDFRASGSGLIRYEKYLFDENIIRLAMQIAEKLNGQSVALDFVYDNDQPKVVEVSYGFIPKGYDFCEGYWDADMNWHEGKFEPCEWMVERVLEQIRKRPVKSV